MGSFRVAFSPTIAALAEHTLCHLARWTLIGWLNRICFFRFSEIKSTASIVSGVFELLAGQDGD